MVRTWRAATDIRIDEDTRSERLRGVVEHIASGESVPFRDADELLDFLVERAVEEEAGTGRPR